MSKNKLLSVVILYLQSLDLKHVNEYDEWDLLYEILEQWFYCKKDTNKLYVIKYFDKKKDKINENYDFIIDVLMNFKIKNHGSKMQD